MDSDACKSCLLIFILRKAFVSKLLYFFGSTLASSWRNSVWHGASQTHGLSRPPAVYKTMAERGVVIRYRGNEIHCADCVRITVGTAEENKALMALLRTVLGELSA